MMKAEQPFLRCGGCTCYKWRRNLKGIELLPWQASVLIHERVPSLTASDFPLHSQFVRASCTGSIVREGLNSPAVNTSVFNFTGQHILGALHLAFSSSVDGTFTKRFKGEKLHCIVLLHAGQGPHCCSLLCIIVHC
jgi:hypothetical protein